MTQRNKLILLVGEVAIPILGYFFWSWNLYFIFLFMFLDLLSYNVLFWFKYKKINAFRAVQTTKIPFKQLATLLILSGIIFVGYTYLFNKIQGTNFAQEMINFFFYKDMGFSQGYILLPLIVVSAYMSYKTEFVLLGKFTQLTVKQLNSEYVRNNLAGIVLLVVLGLLELLNISNSAVYFYVGMGIYTVYAFTRQK
ncbi:MAG TPA: hypothetical protein PLP27_00295 [Crocinitomicaceae bacterium]|nr:hypothetical protein [Crocinitomicaceae bacterium]